MDNTSLYSDDHALATDTSDAHGRFALLGLPAGVYDLRYDFSSQPFVAPPTLGFHAVTGANAPRVTGQPGVIVRGWVRETDGTPGRVS